MAPVGDPHLLVLLGLGQPVQAALHVRLQLGGPEQQAEAQRQEDRDDGDEVITEIDHQNNPDSQYLTTSHCVLRYRRNIWPVREYASTISTVADAASTRAISAQPDTRGR